MNVSQPLELAVVSGQQKGARASVKYNDAMKIGSHDDSDIVINDSQAQGDNISLTIVGKAAKMTVNSGSVYYKGQAVDQGAIKTVGMYDRIKIGNTELAYGEADSPYWQLDKITLWHKVQRMIEHYRHIFLPLIAVFLVLISVYLIISNTALIVADSQSKQQTIDSIQQLKATLVDENMTGVSVNDDQLPVIISGYLGDRAEYRKAINVLNNSGITYHDKLLVESVLAEQVGAIFRLYGYSVEVKVDKNSAVVMSESSDKKGLLSVKSSVLSDVPSLSTVSIKHQPSAVFFNHPGKNIVMAVQGSNGYVLTQDGTKYYLGSTLEDGHVISDITGRVVKLTIDNNIIEHIF